MSVLLGTDQLSESLLQREDSSNRWCPGCHHALSTVGDSRLARDEIRDCATYESLQNGLERNRAASAYSECEEKLFLVDGATVLVSSGGPKGESKSQMSILQPFAVVLPPYDSW